MTAVQLDLFADARPVYGITVCPWCGQTVEAVPIADAGDSWQPALLFGYIGQKAHEREHHPERTT